MTSSSASSDRSPNFTEEVEYEASDSLPAEGAVGQKPLDFVSNYLETLSLIERLHRLMLDVLKDEFERLGRSDVNSVQALLLFHIADDELTVGDLKSRGYYQGSNVSYNLKKLVENGFLHHQRSRVDRRSVRIRATAKGREVSNVVRDLFERHAAAINDGAVIDPKQSATMNAAMLRLERFWRDRIRFIY